MKILYLHRVASKDGQYVHIEEIIKSLKKLGHTVIIVAPSAGENQAFGGDGGFIAKLKAKLPHWLYDIAEFMYSFYAFLKISKVILTEKPEFIYERYNLLCPAGIWAKKLFKLPLLLEVNSPLFEERNKYDGIYLKKLAKWSQQYTWNNADRLLPVTHVLAKSLIAYGVPESKIAVIANGINKDEFVYAQHKNPLTIDTANKVVIGFVGFCREWHGLDKIVDLLSHAENDNLFFLVVGDGPVIPQIRQQAKELNVEDRLFITGLVKRSEMPKWLLPIDIALQPEVVAYASPLKMLEYMATGKAIVAPARNNIKELLAHNVNALLFEPNNDKAFIQSIQSLANDEAQRHLLATNAKLAIDQYGLTWDHNAQRIIAIADQELNLFLSEVN